MIPSTVLGFVFLLLAAFVAGFGWALGARLAGKL